MSPRTFHSVQVENSECGFGNGASRDNQIHGGNNNLANRDQHPVLANAIPNSDILSPRDLGNGDVYVKNGHAYAIEKLLAHLFDSPAFQLRNKQSISVRLATLNSPSKIHLMHTIHPRVAIQPHHSRRREVERRKNKSQFRIAGRAA